MLPVFELSEQDGWVGIFELLVKTGLASSNSQARRELRAGGIRLNDAKIFDENIHFRVVNNNICVSFDRPRKELDKM